MTFRRYSRLTSSSFLDSGDSVLDLGDATEGVGDSGAGVVPSDLQYPNPGFLCRSNKAADAWTLRSSSRRVYFE